MLENKFKVVVLAAGLGKRMGNPNLPKVLVPLKGKPILSYVIKAVKDSGIGNKPTVIVGKGADKVKAVFGNEVEYVLQEQQLGTGHAVAVAEKALEDATDILVINGDQPLISPQLIEKLSETHLSSNGVLTMATVTVPDFESWRGEFKSFAKIVRDLEGRLQRIVERKDASDAQTAIKELNPQYFCFKADWLWKNLKKIIPNNAQGEYYLTDLVKMAVEQGHNIVTVPITDIKETLGINTPEHLKEIEKLF